MTTKDEFEDVTKKNNRAMKAPKAFFKELKQAFCNHNWHNDRFFITTSPDKKRTTHVQRSCTKCGKIDIVQKTRL